MEAGLLYCDIEREKEGGERIPVAHDNYLKSVISSRQSAVIRLTVGSTSEPLSSGIDVSQDNVFSELKNFGP